MQVITLEDFITFGLCRSFRLCINSHCGLLAYDAVVWQVRNVLHPYLMGRNKDGDRAFL
jgi:hypothetical protein